MSISDKERKELWAKSGNRCAICKAELFQSVDGNSFNFEYGAGGRGDADNKGRSMNINR